MRKVWAVALVCGALFAAGAQSQTQSIAPENVARAFFNAVATERWSEAAGYLDLDGFERFRQQMIRNYRNEALPQWTADSLMKHQPDMPRAVAEYQVAQMKKAFSESNTTFRFQFANVRTLDELAALSPGEAAARMIEAEDVRYRFRLNQDMARCVPPYKKAAPRVDIAPDEVLGTIVRDSVAYVLHREGAMTVDSVARGITPRQSRPRMDERDWFALPPMVMQLKNFGGRWLIVGGWGMLNRSNEVIAGCVRDD